VSLRTLLAAAISIVALVAWATPPVAIAATPKAKTAKAKKTPASRPKARKIIAYSGKISAVKPGRDRKRKRYWEYRLRTAKGETVLVHDYRYGRYRQPATAGIRTGAKRSVRGFFVHISPKVGSTKKVPVLIVSPAN
jgi:hypothetical protein